MLGMEMQRKQQANVRANWEIYCGTEGFAGVLILFWADFWADFIWHDAVFLCIYYFMRFCWRSDHSCFHRRKRLHSHTPLVRLQQDNRVLIDWLIEQRPLGIPKVRPSTWPEETSNGTCYKGQGHDLAEVRRKGYIFKDGDQPKSRKRMIMWMERTQMLDVSWDVKNIKGWRSILNYWRRICN
jgi:hypothetical protein